jgi:hypothetical protein
VAWDRKRGRLHLQQIIFVERSGEVYFMTVFMCLKLGLLLLLLNILHLQCGIFHAVTHILDHLVTPLIVVEMQTRIELRC